MGLRCVNSMSQGSRREEGGEKRDWRVESKGGVRGVVNSEGQRSGLSTIKRKNLGGEKRG